MAPDPAGATAVARFEERLNPVLVKEVRAALRGKAFAIGFVLVLGLTLIVSTIALIGVSDEAGRPSGMAYIASLGWVFVLGLNVLVPFSAMTSMATEHDEAALELLQLSGLSPGRVVRGKLGAAAVQTALLYAAALPFLAFGVLLPGVDPMTIALGIPSSFALSVAFSAIGILLGAMLRFRWARALGYVFLALMLLFSSPGIMALSMATRFGGGPAMGGGAVSLALLVVCAFVCAWACTLAAARIAHAEEDRSRGFRLLTTAALVVVCGFGLAAVSSGDLRGWFLPAVILGIPVGLIGLAEPERLPRAALAGRWRSGVWSWLNLPWTAGGGRAVLLVLLHAGLVLGAGLAAAIRLGTPDALTVVAAVLCVQLYVLAALLLPSGVLSPWLGRTWAQLVARLAMVLLPLAALLVPTFARFLAGGGSESFRHAGNPAHLALDLLDDGRLEDKAGFSLLALAVLLGIALNAPRAVRGVLELRRARSRRAAQEALRAATQP